VGAHSAQGVTEARAAGKLFLCGEYALLEGWPAVVMGLDAEMTLRLASGPPGAWRVWRRSEEAVAAWQWPRVAEVDGVTPDLCAALWRVLGPAWDDVVPPGFVGHCEDGAFVSADGEKIGIGSSAAAVALWVRALAAHTGLGQALDDERRSSWLLARAQAVHAVWRGGGGSGADVAAAWCGGLLGVTVDATGSQVLRRLSRASLPPWRALWSRRPADSRDYVAAWRSFAAAQPRRARGLVGCLGEGAAAIMACLEGEGEAGEIVAALAALDVGLEALGRAMGRPVVTEQGLALRAAARRAGLVSKSSGAGGGDVTLVAGCDLDALVHFQAHEAVALGYVPLPWQVGASLAPCTGGR